MTTVAIPGAIAPAGAKSPSAYTLAGAIAGTLTAPVELDPQPARPAAATSASRAPQTARGLI